MNVIRVHTSSAYDVVVGSDLLNSLGSMTRKVVPSAGKAVLVSDDMVFPLYGSTVSKSLTNSGFGTFSFVFPHGENSKNLENYGRLLNEMCLHHMTRADLVLALGGGVVGDLAGFAAATYQRGIALVQVPTSLLAAVDSSVGGKTAIDLPAGKNQAGCFYQPKLVVCDTETLSTLADEEYHNGCAEIIKYAILDGDNFFSRINDIPVCQQYEDVITRCVEIKKNLVEADEHDTGARMLLNLGHTIGHGIETCSGYAISHGQAVAIGLAGIARAAAQKSYCSEQTCASICRLVSTYGLPSEIPFAREDLAEAALSDKKNTSDTMRLIVPYEIGHCEIVEISKTDFPNWLAAAGAKMM